MQNSNFITSRDDRVEEKSGFLLLLKRLDVNEFEAIEVTTEAALASEAALRLF
jgi:hypothetical protein